MKRLRTIQWRLGQKRNADLLLWLAITVPVFFSDELPSDDQPAGLPLPWVQIAAVPLLGLAVAVRGQRPLLAASVPVVLGLAATPELNTTNFVFAQIVLVFMLGRRTGAMRTGLLFFGAVCAAGLALAVVTPAATRWSWFGLGGSALLTILLPWLAGRYIRQRGELVRTGWELAERLEREHDLIGERTRLLERSRIAGDMHDTLGHELSLIALRAAALQVRPGLDEAAREAVRELRVSAATVTERLHDIIGMLREDGELASVLPSGDTIVALIERAAASGMAVTLDGELPPLPPMADRAAYRVVQEALTNATKHAPGAAVTVRLGADAAVREAHITVANARPTVDPQSAVGSDGFGLVGLDERVRLAGGRLRAQAVDGGFQITARLPLTASAAATPPDSQRQFAQARRNARRGMLDAIWVPAAVAAALAALTFGYHLYYSYRSLLDAEAYAELRIGQSQSAIEQRLPTDEAGDDFPARAPADPPGTDDCRFYRTTALSLDPSSAYRLCFTDGKLSHKDKVEILRQ